MQIAIGLYQGFTALDFVGPYQVLTLLPDATVTLCAEAPGVVADDQGLLRLEVDRAYADVPAPDLLFVPGSGAAMEMAASGHPIVEWIRTAHEHTTWTTSVCTGSILLAAAGLLRGQRATSHWLTTEVLRSYGAEPVEDRVVEAGKVVTAAGISSGIDLALVLAAKVAGAETAQAIQLALEYDPQPPFDTGSVAKAPAAVAELATRLLLPEPA